MTGLIAVVVAHDINRFCLASVSVRPVLAGIHFTQNIFSHADSPPFSSFIRVGVFGMVLYVSGQENLKFCVPSGKFLWRCSGLCGYLSEAALDDAAYFG